MKCLGAQDDSFGAFLRKLLSPECAALKDGATGRFAPPNTACVRWYQKLPLR